jgi:glycosyltransferase involved in cell wall biosynthesis
MRIALITNIPAPYRLPVWDSLAQKAGSLHVLFCAASEPNRLWENHLSNKFLFTYSFIPGYHLFIRELEWGIYWNPSLWKELTIYRPTHLVITGYESPSYLLALFYAKINKIPVTIWWESHLMSSRFPRGIIGWLKKKILNKYDSFCGIGHSAASYLIDGLGIKKNRIEKAINVCDANYLYSLADVPRRKLSNSRPVRFLYIGQFITRKGIMELLEAFSTVSAQDGILRLVGYGPLESDIKNYISQKKLENIEFIGAVKKIEEVVKFYAWADILILPSLAEVWGLVVNEALACGVYVMASKFAGATYDLIEQAPLDVGVSFDPTNRDQFKNALSQIIKKRATIDPEAISEWGLKHTPDHLAQSVINAVLLAEKCLEEKKSYI